MSSVYDWAYVNPRYVRWLDRNAVVRTLLFGQDRRLMRAYLSQVEPGSRVWQVAHVYGDLVSLVADRIGPHGQFDLTDVTPIQVAHALPKLAGRPWARVIHRDAALWHAPQPYALCASFFLLHEVPDAEKRAIVDRMLAQVAPGGQALFVDYHRPHPLHPVGWILRQVNRWLEPFAEALWTREIRDFATHPEGFSWHKRTVFGGVYQIVLARRNG